MYDLRQKSTQNYARLALNALNLFKIKAKFNAKYVRSTPNFNANYVRIAFNALNLCKINAKNQR